MKYSRKTKIMLVEDSQNLRFVLKDYFEMMNYDVIDYGDGESVLRNYQDGCCDICLLDISLPKKDGYAVIRELHNVTPELPVIFITEKESKEDRIKGFKAGCDDYVTKPFSTEELLLRMEAILKRCGKSSKKERFQDDIIITIGDFIFEYNELRLIYGEEVRILTRKEAKLLKLLHDHKNKVVPRDIITKEIWGETRAAYGRSMDVFLSKVRKHLQLDESVEDTKVEIINVHGTGYLLRIKDKVRGEK